MKYEERLLQLNSPIRAIAFPGIFTILNREFGLRGELWFESNLQCEASLSIQQKGDAYEEKHRLQGKFTMKVTTVMKAIKQSVLTLIVLAGFHIAAGFGSPTPIKARI